MEHCGQLPSDIERCMRGRAMQPWPMCRIWLKGPASGVGNDCREWESRNWMHDLQTLLMQDYDAGNGSGRWSRCEDKNHCWMDNKFKLRHGLFRTIPGTQLCVWKQGLYENTTFIHPHPLSMHSVGLETLPAHPVRETNTFVIAFRSSMRDPEVVSPMIPASGRPIGLLSTKRSCTSNPSPI